MDSFVLNCVLQSKKLKTLMATISFGITPEFIFSNNYIKFILTFSNDVKIKKLKV